MELAIIVLIWALTVLLILNGLMLIGLIAAKTNLLNAQAKSEGRFRE